MCFSTYAARVMIKVRPSERNPQQAVYQSMVVGVVSFITFILPDIEFRLDNSL